MGHQTKVQKIVRKKGSDQWYVSLPAAVADAMDFVKGEAVSWHVEDKANMVLHRSAVPPSPVTVKKTMRRS